MPLTSWTCDQCGDQITDPERGIVTWREEDSKGFDFKIVHKNMDGRDCDPGSINGYSSSVSIDQCTGSVGQANLLAFLSVGPLMGGGGDTWPRVKDFDEFTDLFRRVQTPWYEEARLHFADEEVAHWLGDANEYYPYIPEVLERIAKRTLGQ